MVKYIGLIGRDKVNRLYGRSRAGIVLYQQAANHVASQPIKMFEFMAAGLPVIAVVEVRTACERLLENAAEGQAMGRAGRNAVLEKYNWDIEKSALLGLYQELEKGAK